MLLKTSYHSHDVKGGLYRRTRFCRAKHRPSSSKYIYGGRSRTRLTTAIWGDSALTESGHLDHKRCVTKTRCEPLFRTTSGGSRYAIAAVFPLPSGPLNSDISAITSLLEPRQWYLKSSQRCKCQYWHSHI